MQLVAPQDIWQKLLASAHKNTVVGHRGTCEATRRIAEDFFWPSMQSDARIHVKSCNVCQQIFSKGRVSPIHAGRGEMAAERLSEYSKQHTKGRYSTRMCRVFWNCGESSTAY
ncbi:hypothetical protein HPB48_020603 [Haemaphysalis longicornis]|uniref:Integrase zinc-binding domain-containing protein n=1 Tax=Haemaphysalis longicornis TaxID=44386 RepID=A0A9J6H012_HAELO|nr:hypothetical protein HPB48_020603 [Haemaphysalis longicornis]